jgi:shikimate kinase
MTADPHDGARRIVIVGPTAAGKSTLALALGGRSGLPIFHLDAVAEAGRDPRSVVEVVGVQSDRAFDPRPLAEREDLARRLAADPAWIAEGAFIGWTEPLLERADRIIWLDHVPYLTAVRRILGRVRTSSAAESASHDGVSRLVRPVAFVRHGLELVLELCDAGGYYWSRSTRPRVERDIEARRWDRLTRRAVGVALAPHGERVIRVRDEAGLASLYGELGVTDTGPAPATRG